MSVLNTNEALILDALMEVAKPTLSQIEIIWTLTAQLIETREELDETQGALAVLLEQLSSS